MSALRRRSVRLASTAAAFALVVGLATPASAATGTYTGVSVTPTSPVAAASTTWTVGITSGGTVTGASAVRCVELSIDSSGAFDSTSPAATVTGNPGGTSLITSAGTWTAVGAVASSSKYRWTNTGATFAASGTITFSVTNPAAGAYFVKLQTFATACGDAVYDVGSSGVVITSTTTVSLVVDPTLNFTVAGNNAACNGISNTIGANATSTSVPLGHINDTTLASGSQTVTLSTNAANGFTVAMRSPNSTGVTVGAASAMIDGNGHALLNRTGAAFSAGTDGFAYTSNDNAGSGIAAGAVAPVPSSNATVLSKAAGQTTGTACVGYLAGAATNTTAGAYSTNIIYTAIPNF